MNELIEEICQTLDESRIAEFEFEGEEYFVQIENNKGYDYIGLWHEEGFPTCLNRIFFDIMVGVSEELVEELLSSLPSYSASSLFWSKLKPSDCY